jgi:hypothetical protein
LDSSARRDERPDARDDVVGQHLLQEHVGGAERGWL